MSIWVKWVGRLSVLLVAGHLAACASGGTTESADENLIPTEAGHAEIPTEAGHAETGVSDGSLDVDSRLISDAPPEAVFAWDAGSPPIECLPLCLYEAFVDCGVPGAAAPPPDPTTCSRGVADGKSLICDATAGYVIAGDTGTKQYYWAAACA